MKNNTYFLFINIIFITIIQFFNALPWWSFLFITLVMGFIFTFKRWKIKPFAAGFISGSLNWSSISLFLHLHFDGLLINKIAPIFYINTPLFFVLAGIIGGILNGLASYTGYCVLVKEDVLDLE